MGDNSGAGDNDDDGDKRAALGKPPEGCKTSVVDVRASVTAQDTVAEEEEEEEREEEAAAAASETAEEEEDDGCGWERR